MNEALGSDHIAQFRAAADPRDRDFVDYWASRIDLSDPAAPHWMEHFNLRIGECRKMLAQIEAQRSLHGLRALDIGCQTGALSVLMGERGAEVVGIDTQDWVVEAARRRRRGVAVRHSRWRVAKRCRSRLLVRCRHVRRCDRALRRCASVSARNGARAASRWHRVRPRTQSLRTRMVHARSALSTHGRECSAPSTRTRLRRMATRPTRLRRRVFPVGTQVARTLRQSGLEIVESPIHACERWWSRRAPPAISRATPLARAWGKVRLTSSRRSFSSRRPAPGGSAS